MKFTNVEPRTTSNDYLYLYLTNCRTAAGMTAISCQIKMACWYLVTIMNNDRSNIKRRFMG